MDASEPAKRLSFGTVAGVTGFISSVLGIIESVSKSGRSFGDLAVTALYYTGHIAMLTIGFWLLLGGLVASIWNAAKPSPGVTTGDRMFTWIVFLPCLALGVVAGIDRGRTKLEDAPTFWTVVGVLAIVLPIAVAFMGRSSQPPAEAETEAPENAG